MKNAVPKNDKKKRKQMTEEIAKLEANLSQKHEEELAQFKSDNKVLVTDWLVTSSFPVYFALSFLTFLTTSTELDIETPIWPGGRGDEWNGGPESRGWRTGGGDTATRDQGPEEKGEKVQHWNRKPAKEVTLDISYCWKAC